MSMNGFQNPAALIEETVWLDASKLNEAEARYNEYLCQEFQCPRTNKVSLIGAGDGPVKPKAAEKPKAPEQQAPVVTGSSLISEIENIRLRIQNFIKESDKEHSFPGNIIDRLQRVEAENFELRQALTLLTREMQVMNQGLGSLERQVEMLQTELPKKGPCFKVIVKDRKPETLIKNGTAEEDDDDDVDLFGSDEETEDEKRVKEERLKAYENKKSKKAQVVAKSSVVLDVKPWSDETDLKDMETNVRKIESVGLKWGASKLVPLAYGIKKLQIIAIVEDDNCSIDWLQEQIEAIEDLVQSVDIAAFNKL